LFAASEVEFVWKIAGISLASRLLLFVQMSSLENIYMKMTPTLEPTTLAGLHHEASQPETQKQVGREVAHELNNIFTIIRGYAERMLIKHGENPALRPELLLIAENVKRAESLVRHSTPPRPRPTAMAAVHA
jgi:signal transduction histidine kinase